MIINNFSTTKQYLNMQHLPYRSVPDAPESYNAGHLASRMIDGLGYRYYWATEGLNNAALDYRPPNNGRSCLETLQHICDLTEGILHVAKAQPIKGPFDMTALSYEQLRENTLLNIETSSHLIKALGNDLEKAEMLLETKKGPMSFPFWNVVIGPISDAIYHTGQIVSFRRSAGNPVHSGINPFLGYTKDV